MADKATTPLEKVIQTAIDTALKDIHTCLPAVVTKVNHAEQLIDAQLVIKRKMGGELINLPLLVNVPIRYWRSKIFSITFPIKVDDHVRIIFAERSIDTWLAEGGIQNPFDFRKFSLSDAFAEPAMYHQKNVIPNFDPTNLEIKTNSGDTKIIVKASENIEVITIGDVKIDCNNLDAIVAAEAKITSATLVANISGTTNITCPTVNVIGNLVVTGGISWSGVAQGAGGSPVAFSGGLVNIGGDIVSDGKSLETHIHPQGNDSNGNTEVDTGAPL
jgi:hypothetical protein